jgi:hypothetical protein
MNEDLQMSCIVDKKGESQEESNAVNSSDKFSQEESFTEI